MLKISRQFIHFKSSDSQRPPPPPPPYQSTRLQGLKADGHEGELSVGLYSNTTKHLYQQLYIYLFSINRFCIHGQNVGIECLVFLCLRTSSVLVNRSETLCVRVCVESTEDKSPKDICHNGISRYIDDLALLKWLLVKQLQCLISCC